MAAGKHTSIRVALAVPPRIHEQLAAWAEYEGRPMASLCMYLIEKSLREAQREGIAPKFDEVVGMVMDDQSEGTKAVMLEEHRRALAEEVVRTEKYTKPFDEMTKKEKLLTAISEALFD